MFTDLSLLFFRFKSVLISKSSVQILQVLRCPGTPEICDLKTARHAWNPPEYKIQNYYRLCSSKSSSKMPGNRQQYTRDIKAIACLVHNIIMYILLYYWYRQAGGGGGGEGRACEASDCEASSRLAAGLVPPRPASPRLASPRLEN